jgi:hypothetical protein
MATAIAAFGHGSLLLKGDLESIVIALRVAGIVGLAIGSVWWWRGRGIARELLWVGLAGTSIAVVLEISGAGRASDAALAAGSFMIGTALLVASRRSVAARVAASAAGTLLLVVLVLSVALSAVLSSSIEREELTRLQSRANTEANLATNSFVNEVPTAHLAAAFLFSQGGLTTGQVQGILTGLHAVYPDGGFEILVPPTAAATPAAPRPPRRGRPPPPRPRPRPPPQRPPGAGSSVPSGSIRRRPPSSPAPTSPSRRAAPDRATAPSTSSAPRSWRWPPTRSARP